MICDKLYIYFINFWILFWLFFQVYVCICIKVYQGFIITNVIIFYTDVTILLFRAIKYLNVSAKNYHEKYPLGKGVAIHFVKKPHKKPKTKTHKKQNKKQKHTHFEKVLKCVKIGIKLTHVDHFLKNIDTTNAHWKNLRNKESFF